MKEPTFIQRMIVLAVSIGIIFGAAALVARLGDGHWANFPTVMSAIILLAVCFIVGTYTKSKCKCKCNDDPGFL